MTNWCKQTCWHSTKVNCWSKYLTWCRSGLQTELYGVFAWDPFENQLSFLCSATSNTCARKHCDTVWRLSRVSLWLGNGAFKHREHKIILPCWQGRRLQRVRDVHNPTTERQNSIMSNLHRATWAVSAKTVKPLNSEAFDYCELCSVHAQQCCFSLAEYTAHTHTQEHRT